MWWQMTWRAPDIKADTLVMASISGGYNPQQDYEIWGPLNLIYNPNPAKVPAIQAHNYLCHLYLSGAIGSTCIHKSTRKPAG